jgi:hypothetical protein
VKQNIISKTILVAFLLLISIFGTTQIVEAKAFPDLLSLPDGFRPEGIASGRGTRFFVGSLFGGAIYKGDLRTGEGEILVPGQEGRVAVGLAVDLRTNYLFVAGGPLGTAYIYDAVTGANIAEYQLTTDPSTFVQDVVVTRTAAYFTDSFRPFLYRVPLSNSGDLPNSDEVEEIPLGGDFVFIPMAFNTNGIDATSDGASLVIVNSTTETLYTVEPNTGDAVQIDLGGNSLPNGDGILLDGLKLYVVQNRLNQIAVVQLEPGFISGEVVGTITDPEFDVPTTIAEFGAYLYAVNARFGTPPTPDTSYTVVQVQKN